VLDPVSNYVANFSDPILTITSGLLVIITTLILWLWFSNRRKYHSYKHAIPAHVVKNYLDSIIQNSTALKSSLFRGGGLDVSGVPSVMPLQGLGGGDGLAVAGAPSTALLEELNLKKALIAQLESQLSSIQNANRDLESKLSHTQVNLTSAEAKIKELEALLAQMKSGATGGDEALKAELKMVTKERDEIRDRLKEFEIISDDLANLKRLQQENEQLKRSLAAQGNAPKTVAAPKEEPIAAPQADVAELLEDIGGANETITSDDSKALEDFLAEPAAATETEPAPEVAAAAPDVQLDNNANNENKPKSDKTPEDLLSEFEKMLG
jgi:predicted nuclease with TOPRIM domain